MLRSLFPTCLLGLVAVVGCSSVTDDDAARSESANTEGRPLTVITAREWGRCWFDVAGNDAKLSCTSTARGDDPLDAKVEVTAAGMGDPAHFVSLSKTLDIEAGATVVLGTIPRASFPVILMLHATLSRDASLAIGDAHGTDLWLKPTINRPEDLPASRAAQIKQPFDLWPTAFIAVEGQEGFSVNASYSVPIAPYAGFLNETSMALTKELRGRDVRGKIEYFAAPPAGEIALDLSTNGGPRQATLAHPGYYAVGASGMRPATPAEIAAAFPTSTNPSGPTEPAPTDPAPAEPPPTEPSAPPPVVDADPTCGGNNQLRCQDGSCDDGTRFDSSSYKCTTCGANGQTYCLDGAGNASGSKKCDDGTRFDSSSYKCTTCGAAGQTFCLDGAGNASGNKKCNDGTRFDSSSYLCQQCGGAGQTYCVDDPNNVSGDKICNPGLHFDSSSYTCKP